MQTVHVLRNATTGAILATKVARARSMLSRGVGLLGRGTLAADEGLWIERCGAVHTMGMRVALDLIFLDRSDRVVRIEYGVRPHRLAVTCREAVTVVELGVGQTRPVAVGDRLTLGDAS